MRHTHRFAYLFHLPIQNLVRVAGNSFLICFSRNRRRNCLCIYVFVFSPQKGSQHWTHFHSDTQQQLCSGCPLPAAWSPELSCLLSFLQDVVIHTRTIHQVDYLPVCFNSITNGLCLPLIPILHPVRFVQVTSRSHLNGHRRHQNGQCHSFLLPEF